MNNSYILVFAQLIDKLAKVTHNNVKMMKIDLNLFTIFDTIYRAGSITQAAKILNLSQPAVSHSLAKLRVHFDDVLFIRQGNQMCPTLVAKNVIDDVREALQQLQLSLLQAKQFEPFSSKKQINIALHSSLEASYLPFLMTRLSKESPKTKLTSSRVSRNDIENKLASGDIDLAVDVLLPLSESIYHTQIEQDKLVVVANKHHVGLESKLELAYYLAQNHVLVSSRAQGPGIEDFELGRLGLQRRVGLRCQHLFSACQVVANSQMLLTLPASAATMFTQVLNLTVYTLPVELPVIDVHLYWHTNVDKDPANKWLRNKILMAASSR
jgi:DNA-binding transcriptional LysR family regulator